MRPLLIRGSRRATSSSIFGASARRARAVGRAARANIRRRGVRNSLVIAIAPTATIASIVGCYECIEPQISNLFKRETLSGEFLQVNRYLIDELQGARPVDGGDADAPEAVRGLGAGHRRASRDLKLLYRTVWEVPMRALIDMAAARNAYIDQSSR